MTDKFKSFIDNLANTQVPENVFNQYDYHIKENKLRRDNLLIYLNKMKQLNPSIMFIAEAPGHRGSRITGVPLVNGIDGLDLFGEKNGYKMPFLFILIRLIMKRATELQQRKVLIN